MQGGAVKLEVNPANGGVTIMEDQSKVDELFDVSATREPLAQNHYETHHLHPNGFQYFSWLPLGVPLNSRMTGSGTRRCETTSWLS